MIAGEGKGKAGRGPMDEGTNCLTFVDSVRVAPKIDPTVSQCNGLRSSETLRGSSGNREVLDRTTAKVQTPPKDCHKAHVSQVLATHYKYILNKPFER